MKLQLVPFEGNCPDCLIPTSSRGYDPIQDAGRFDCPSCKVVFMVDEGTGKIIQRSNALKAEPTR